MRLFEIEAGSKRKLTLEEAVSLIDKNCQNYLNSNVTLFRGTAYSSDYYLASPRTNRTPVTSRKFNVDFFNSMMEMIGSNVRKNNSVSFTNSSSIAQMYGSKYYVFPYDGAEFVWSTTSDFINITSLSEMLNNIENIGTDEQVTWAKKYISDRVEAKGRWSEIETDFFNEISQVYPDLLKDVYRSVVHTYHVKTGAVGDIDINRKSEIVMTGAPYIAISNTINIILDVVENVNPKILSKFKDQL